MSPPLDGIISQRARNLRTTANICLVVVLIMSIYGYIVLMPSINHFVTSNRQQITTPNQANISEKSPKELAHQKRINKLISVQLILAYAYWSVCGIFVVAIFFVAWLYMREVSRGYLDGRKRIVMDTIGSTTSGPDSDDHNRESDA